MDLLREEVQRSRVSGEGVPPGTRDRELRDAQQHRSTVSFQEHHASVRELAES
ncbi:MULTISPECIES: hypothetical protein [unclassified Rathayibacter]|uniref:hypothetical protein n=1 Tax=unclassified Rathayibacter TaxID=2609250 RepID=UPI0014048420|nr:MULTISPECIES: hypothetical protein [unclassified Rathayibacter]